MIQVFSREFEGQTENCFKTVIFAVLFGAASGTKITRLKVKCVISTVILCWCCVNPPTFIASSFCWYNFFFSLSLRLALACPRQEQWTLDSGHETLVKTSWLQRLCTVCMKPGMWIWVHVNVRGHTQRYHFPKTSHSDNNYLFPVTCLVPLSMLNNEVVKVLPL